MGNHAAGRAMVGTAVALADSRSRTGLSALEILDAACRPHENCDAEFDDEARPETVFGKLITEAFHTAEIPPAPERNPADDDEYADWWWDHYYDPFRKRYNLW